VLFVVFREGTERGYYVIPFSLLPHAFNAKKTTQYKMRGSSEQNGARIECGIMKNLHTSFDEKHKHLYNRTQPASELESITFIIFFFVAI
jgi:hypothetical protein